MEWYCSAMAEVVEGQHASSSLRVMHIAGFPMLSKIQSVNLYFLNLSFLFVIFQIFNTVSEISNFLTNMEKSHLSTKISAISDTLTIQITAGGGVPDDMKDSVVEPGTGLRNVRLRKRKGGGLGLSIKVLHLHCRTTARLEHSHPAQPGSVLLEPLAGQRTSPSRPQMHHLPGLLEASSCVAIVSIIATSRHLDSLMEEDNKFVEVFKNIGILTKARAKNQIFKE